MRDILDKLQTLEESTGLAGRAPGAVFKNSSGDEIVFNGIKFYPPGGGKLEGDALQDALAGAPSDVQWLNAKTARVGGFAIANFTDSSGSEINVGQYFQQINPNLKKNYMPNKVLGYDLDTKASKKNKEKLKPQDLITGNKENLSIADIMSQLAGTLGTDNPLYEVAHRVALGEPLPLTFNAPPDVSFSGFRDYFCEILQPIAILKGQYTGNAAEAAEKFLDGSFQGARITFDESVTAGLSDSILSTKDGKQVLISSKGGSGAKASAKNLYVQIQQLQETPGGKKFLAKYREEVDIITNIVKSGQNGSPLYLAVKYDIITPEEADQIRGLRKMAPIDLKQIGRVPISNKLKQFALDRNTKTPQSTDLYYHILAQVAQLAADQVNDKTDFSKAAAEILNNGALIQVYTKAKQTGNQWTLQEFETVFPSNQIKGVYLDSGKTYYSTDIKGNYTFKIDKGGGKPPKTTSEPSDSDIEIDLSRDSEAIAGGRSRGGPTRARGDVGRKKR